MLRLARAFEVLEHLATMGGLTLSEDPGPFDFAHASQARQQAHLTTALEAEHTGLVTALARHLDPPAR